MALVGTKELKTDQISDLTFFQLIQYDDVHGERTFVKSIELSEIIQIDNVRLEQKSLPKYLDGRAAFSVSYCLKIFA